MPRTRITSEADFQTFLDSIADDASMASIHWQLAQDLTKSADVFYKEMRQSWTFWTLTVSAHRDATFIRLTRLYDQDPSVLSLKTWLQAIQENLPLVGRNSS